MKTTIQQSGDGWHIKGGEGDAAWEFHGSAEQLAAHFAFVMLELASLHQRLAEAEASVPKSMRTKDGVAVTPMMLLYHPLRGRRYVADDVLYATVDGNFGENDHVDNSELRVTEDERIRVDYLYSTRAAALAAKGGE